MLSVVIPCLLALSIAPAQAAFKTYPVSTPAQLKTAFAAVQNELTMVDLQLVFLDHMVTNFTVQDVITNVASLALVGNCTTPPPDAATRGSLAMTTPAAGACGLALGQTTQFSGADATNIYRKIYIDNMLIYSSTPVDMTFQYNTVWMVNSELSGFGKTTLHIGSLYMIDSAVTNVSTGLTAQLGGSTSDPGVSSESSFVLSRSTVTNPQAGSAQLSSETNATMGYVILHNSMINGSNQQFFIGVQAPGQMVHFYHDVTINVFLQNATVVMDMPFTAANPPPINYTTANQAYLAMLETANVPGVAKAMDPLNDNAGLAPGTPVAAPPPGTPAASPPPGTPATMPPGSSPSPTGAAASFTLSGALGLVMLLAAVCL